MIMLSLAGVVVGATPANDRMVDDIYASIFSTIM